MKRLTWFIFTILCLSPLRGSAEEKLALTQSGRQLRSILDSLDVEHHWLPGKCIAWKTGLPDGRPASRGPHTHCSAFVAAVCARLKAPMLWPRTNAEQKGLANRQHAWLVGEGKKQGWKRVGPIKAQTLANEGKVVVASWVNQEKDGYHNGSGHIAMVRPQLLTTDRVQKKGPQITQAGGHNFKTTTVARGFSGRAWQRRQVQYFVYSAGTMATVHRSSIQK